MSDFIESTLSNTYATFANKKKEYKVVADVDACLFRIASNLSYPRDFVAALFLLRSHSAYRAACRLALSGQVTETYVLLRSCLKYAMYALHINKKPSLAEVWLARHDDDASLAAVRSEFKHSNVSATLAHADKTLSEFVERLYERTIDFGAHPNERAVSGSGNHQWGATQKTYADIYARDGLALEHALKTTAQCGLGSLLIFREIFPERFALLNIGKDIDRLRGCL